MVLAACRVESVVLLFSVISRAKVPHVGQERWRLLPIADCGGPLSLPDTERLHLSVLFDPTRTVVDSRYRRITAREIGPLSPLWGND